MRISVLLRSALAWGFLASPLYNSLVGAETSTLRVGSVVTSVVLGKQTYDSIKIRSVNRSRVTVEHAGGLLSVPWEQVPPQWREELMPLIPPEPTPRPSLAARSQPPRVTKKGPSLASEQPLGNEPKYELQPLVDYRPRIRELGLWIKNQGRRPSCTIFSMLGALEYVYAQRTGKIVRFDEEYLIRAAGVVTGRPALAGDGVDAGYSIAEIMQTIQKAGLKVSEESQQKALAEGEDPADLLPTSQRIQFRLFPPASPERQMIYLVQALNAGLPVPVGLRWPSPAATQGGLIDTQDPDDDFKHAVTLIGYENPTGSIEDVVFLFRNSWGPQWGSAGFGRVSYRYLVANIESAILLDWVNQPSSDARP